MNRQQAQEVLWLYRPGSPQDDSSELREALQLAGQDAELGKWFQEHLAFQAVVRARLRSLPVPSHFKVQTLARQKPASTPGVPLRAWWQQPAWFAAAAALIAVALGLAALWLRPPVPDRFADFRNSMVSRAGRVAYTMDWPTNNMLELRKRFASRGAPDNYQVPDGLEKMTLTGGGALTWRSKPVSMLCFDRGDKQMVFLFVMDLAALKDRPPQKPAPAKVDAMLTVSWTSAGKAYLLAGPENTELLQRFF